MIQGTSLFSPWFPNADWHRRHVLEIHGKLSRKCWSINEIAFTPFLPVCSHSIPFVVVVCSLFIVSGL